MASEQSFTVEIDDRYGPDARAAIALEIMDFVVKRTQEGEGVLKTSDGRVYRKDFPAYSKSYKDSVNFRAAGKASNVNLTLTGDMLANIRLLRHRAGSITIGYGRSDEDTPKVEGNVTGSYGTESPNRKRARDFLGIHAKDLESILVGFPLKDREALRSSIEKVKALFKASEEALDV